MPTAELKRPSDHGLFTTTRWSLVRAAGDAASAESEAALAWLCEAYWYPLYACARHRGRKPEEAEDLVQGFFEQVLAGKFFASLKDGHGSFRAFLKVCFDNFCTGEYKKAQQLKRGGGLRGIPLDEAAAESRFQRDFTDPRTPERDFDRAWALTLLDRALLRLRDECEAEGRGGRFVIMRRFLQGERGERAEIEAAQQLGMSLVAVKSLVHRMRRRFRELITKEIRHTVSTPEGVEDELRHLFGAVGR